MAIFTISDNTIDRLKIEHLWFLILSISILLIIPVSILFFSIENINPKIFIISFCSFIVITSLLLFLRIKYDLKLLENEMKSVQYIIENERLIIMANDFIQYISKNDIKCINKYKNNMILIILNTKQKIKVNKYLDNFEQLIENLNILFQINNINKNINIIEIICVSFIQSLRERGLVS
jgi:hypothetical protein